MADEIQVDIDRSLTLYACRTQLDGDVFITDGSSDEVWGAGGNDADDYDVTMPETAVGKSGHYIGDFDGSANIAAGIYKVAVYIQAGINPADTDDVYAQGEIYWDGTAEINIFTLDTTIEDDVIGADGDTLESLSDQLDVLSAEDSKVQNIYGPGE